MKRVLIMAAAPLLAFAALSLAQPTTASAQSFGFSVGTPRFYGSYYSGTYAGPGCLPQPPVVYRSYYYGRPTPWAGRGGFGYPHHHHGYYGHHGGHHGHGGHGRH